MVEIGGSRAFAPQADIHTPEPQGFRCRMRLPRMDLQGVACFVQSGQCDLAVGLRWGSSISVSTRIRLTGHLYQHSSLTDDGTPHTCAPGLRGRLDSQDTRGDGLACVNLDRALVVHRGRDRYAASACVRPPVRFGALALAAVAL